MEEKDYSANRWGFFRAGLSGHAWLWIAGIVSVVFFAGDFSERFIKPKVSPDVWTSRLEWLTAIGSWPTYVWAIIVLFVLLAGSLETSFRLYRAARRRGDDAIAVFENYRIKQLELTWNPEEEPYRWWDESQSVPVLYFRLRVKNISGVTVNGIKVELSELAPRGALACVPCPIRLMNNILPANEPVHHFSLNPGDKNFIDLMLQSRALDCFWILHAVKNYKVEVPKQAYRMTIRISAIDVPEILRKYELVKDGELWNLREISGLTTA